MRPSLLQNQLARPRFATSITVAKYRMSVTSIVLSSNNDNNISSPLNCSRARFLVWQVFPLNSKTFLWKETVPHTFLTVLLQITFLGCFLHLESLPESDHELLTRGHPIHQDVRDQFWTHHDVRDQVQNHQDVRDRAFLIRKPRIDPCHQSSMGGVVSAVIELSSLVSVNVGDGVVFVLPFVVLVVASAKPSTAGEHLSTKTALRGWRELGD